MRRIIGLFLLIAAFFLIIENSSARTNGKNSKFVFTSNLQSLQSVTGNENVHGSYQNNTNACASCHNTHTAAAKNLLIRDGIFSTCTSCHDGTLGVYNIFLPSTAGMFNGSADGNASQHLATGALHIKAAPGGVIGAELSEDELKIQGGNWIGEFNCASCHSPHGSYSDRLLHYNPNKMGNTNVKNGGKKAVLIPVADFEANILVSKQKDTNEPTGYRFLLIRGNKANHGIIDSNIKDSDTVIALYEWKQIGTTEKYIRSETPWLYGYSFGTPRKFWTQLFKTNTPNFSLNENGNFYNIVDFNDKDVHFDYKNGYAYTSGRQLNDIVRGDIAQAYVVKLDKVKIADFGINSIYAINQAALHQGPVDPLGTAKNDANIQKTFQNGRQVAINLGKGMSEFCSACHSDYLAHSGEAVGVFNETSYRHSTDQDAFNCVRCHFAHGSDVSVMNDANGRTLRDIMNFYNWSESEAKAYMIDQNPSSALKRFTNMSICQACHSPADTAEQMFNDPYAQETQLLQMPDLIPYSEKK